MATNLFNRTMFFTVDLSCLRDIPFCRKQLKTPTDKTTNCVKCDQFSCRQLTALGRSSNKMQPAHVGKPTAAIQRLVVRKQGEITDSSLYYSIGQCEYDSLIRQTSGRQSKEVTNTNGQLLRTGPTYQVNQRWCLNANFPLYLKPFPVISSMDGVEHCVYITPVLCVPVLTKWRQLYNRLIV